MIVQRRSKPSKFLIKNKGSLTISRSYERNQLDKDMYEWDAYPFHHGISDFSV
jgi:hypothetical protein